jgi:hypothetical protein
MQVQLVFQDDFLYYFVNQKLSGQEQWLNNTIAQNDWLFD